MKLALAVLLFLLSVTAAHSQGSLLALDSKNGFRDLKFGTPKHDIKGLEQVCSFAATAVLCERATDLKEIGEAKLDKIYYIFYRDSLAGVVIGFKGSTYREEVINTFIQAYGPCLQYPTTYDKATNKTKTGHLSVQHFYEFDANTYAYWKGSMVELSYLPNRDYDMSTCKEMKLPDDSESSMVLIASRMLLIRSERDKKAAEKAKRAKALRDL